MILRFVLSDPAKSGLESSAWIDGYDYQNKDTQKTLPLRKNKSVIFFSAVYNKKNHVIPQYTSCYSAILDDIFDILQRCNTTTSCQSNSPNATIIENYQKKGY